MFPHTSSAFAHLSATAYRCLHACPITPRVQHVMLRLPAFTPNKLSVTTRLFYVNDHHAVCSFYEHNPDNLIDVSLAASSEIKTNHHVASLLQPSSSANPTLLSKRAASHHLEHPIPDPLWGRRCHRPAATHRRETLPCTCSMRTSSSDHHCRIP